MTAVEADAGTSLSIGTVDPLRYEGHSNDPWEVGGQLLSLIPHGARVLDVGCGTGALSILMRDVRGANVLGVEPHEARAQRAAERGIEVVTGVFTPEIVREHGQFDVVVFADVLEHLTDPTAMLRDVGVALRPGGVVLASIPNVAHWSVRRDLLLGRFDYAPSGIMDSTHLRWFTRATVARMFADAGYRMRSLRSTTGAALPVYVYEWPWSWMSRAVRTAILRRLLRPMPGLFTCQYVVAAEPADRASSP